MSRSYESGFSHHPLVWASTVCHALGLAEAKGLNWRWAQGEVSGCVYKLQRSRGGRSLHPSGPQGPEVSIACKSANSKCLLKKCIRGMWPWPRSASFSGLQFLQPLRGLPWRRIWHSVYMRPPRNARQDLIPGESALPDLSIFTRASARNKGINFMDQFSFLFVLSRFQ